VNKLQRNKKLVRYVIANFVFKTCFVFRFFIEDVTTYKGFFFKKKEDFTILLLECPGDRGFLNFYIRVPALLRLYGQCSS